MSAITIEDALFSDEVSLNTKIEILTYMDNENLSQWTPILTPTEQNNDINGSQHHSSIIDFTYRDATMEDISNASSLGDYDYFSVSGGGYTGHYYEGSDNKFEALVVDPPSYAIKQNI